MQRGTEPPLHVALCTLDLSPDFLEPRAPVCSGWPHNAPVLERFDARTDRRALVECGTEFCLELCSASAASAASARNSENSADANLGPSLSNVNSNHLYIL